MIDQLDTEISEKLLKLVILHKVDPEIAHGNADDLLLEALEKLGMDKTVDAYNVVCEEVGFWYS